MKGAFISISGVVSEEEVKAIARIKDELSVKTPVVLGYQVSNKSMTQGTRNNRQPYFTDLGSLDALGRELGLHNAVHYYTKVQETIDFDLEALAREVEPSLLQFNTLPPKTRVLERAKELGFSTIFKVAVADKGRGGYAVWKGDAVVDASSSDPSALVSQVLERDGLIDYVMFDPSHGTNLGLNLDMDSLAVRFGKEIVKSTDATIVYAGGLNDENIGQATGRLYSLFRNRVALDAESGLRTNDALDLEKVHGYLASHSAVKKSLQF